ncbi:MAG: hypothetical protein ACOYLS_00450 [Polymorphobacter sp.]
MRRLAATATILMLLPIAPARAQATAAILACATIARDAERLACYDAAVADSSPQARAASKARAAESARIAADEAAIAAAAAKAKAEADAIAMEKAKRENFGAEGVTARGVERFAPAPGEIQQIDAIITDVLTNRSSQNVFLLDNGQMWRQVDAGSLPNVRNGDAVKIVKAALGGYDLNFIKQKRRVRVKRLR